MNDDVQLSLKRLSAITGATNSSNLYDESTRHKKQSIYHVKALCNFIALQENLENDDLWPIFSVWVKQNREKTTNYATIYLSNFIVANEGKICMKVAVHTRLTSFRKWGIVISEALQQQINQIDSQWNSIRANRVVENLNQKGHQIKEMIKHWSQIINVLELDQKEFIAKSEQVGVDFNIITESIWSNFKSKRRNNKQRQAHLLMTRAVLSLGRATGCRGINMLDMDLHSWFKVLDDHRLLYKYVNEKNEANRIVNVVIQLHNDPSLCAIVHLAQFVVFVSHVLNMSTKDHSPFHFDKGRGKTVLYPRIYRYVSCILQVASVTAGVRDSEGNKKIGIKKLHSMRGICNDMLVQKGVETSTRRQHLGWTDGSVDDKHYSNSEHAAIASKASTCAFFA